jgi:hypothetical protein
MVERRSWRMHWLGRPLALPMDPAGIVLAAALAWKSR